MALRGPSSRVCALCVRVRPPPPCFITGGIELKKNPRGKIGVGGRGWEEEEVPSPSPTPVRKRKTCPAVPLGTLQSRVSDDISF